MFETVHFEKNIVQFIHAELCLTGQKTALLYVNAEQIACHTSLGNFMLKTRLAVEWNRTFTWSISLIMGNIQYIYAYWTSDDAQCVIYLKQYCGPYDKRENQQRTMGPFLDVNKRNFF